jgi:hypothetical protein
MEWLRLCPKPGFFPQMAQTFDMRSRSVPDEKQVPVTFGDRHQAGTTR